MATTLTNPFPSWGDSGSKPADSTQYDGGDRPYAQHFDYLWDQQDKFSSNVINEFNTEVIRRDGSVAMGADLTVEGPNATSTTTAQDSYHNVFDAAYWDSGTSTSVDVSADLYHSANSDGTSAVNLDVQGTTALTAASGGGVTVPSGGFTVSGSSTISGGVTVDGNAPFTSSTLGKGAGFKLPNTRLHEDGAGGTLTARLNASGGAFEVWDAVNGQTAFQANVGGNVDIPNGGLDVNNHLTANTASIAGNLDVHGFTWSKDANGILELNHPNNTGPIIEMSDNGFTWIYNLTVNDGGAANNGELNFSGASLYEDSNGEVVGKDSAGNTTILT